jgi:putative zinc finger protein
MNCRHAQRATSAAMDGVLLSGPERIAVERHVDGCAACTAFAARSAAVRTAVRIRPAELVPDLTDRIMASVARGPARPARWGGPVRPRRFLPAIAAAIAGTLVGSLVVGGPWGSRTHPASAADIARAIRQAAPSIDAFQGSYAIDERGLSATVPERHLTMDVAYLAPQRFRLDVRDETAYPSAAWTPTDIDYVENVPATFLSGPTGCPATLAGDCSPTRTTTTRTRISAAAPLPADLIAPIATFGAVDGVEVVGDDTVEGHDTVHVAMSFERAAPLFPFLRLGGTWRPFFAQDRVDLWLDTSGWYAVRIDVSPSTDPERDGWEMRFGLPHEPAGMTLLDVTLVSASSDAPAATSFAIPGGKAGALPLELAPQMLGYAPAAPAAPGRLSLVSAYAPQGKTTSLLLYADGLDYLRIGEDPAWPGPQPYGPVTLDAERVEVPGVGPALYEPAGDGWDRRLAIHTADTDLFLDTNLSRDELLAISSSLALRSTLPGAWRTMRSGGLVIEHVGPGAALADLGLESVDRLVPAGYVAASATRTFDRGEQTGVTVTFRRLDTDAAGAPITLHGGTGDGGRSIEPDQLRVSIGTGHGLYSPGSSALTWSDADRSWSLQGDVELSRLVEIATAIRRQT